MTDEAFLRALESCTLPESEFGHVGHVRAAYLYLQQADFAGALARICSAIRNYATHHGKPGRYHETVTVAYLALIQQHIHERGNGGGWMEFSRGNPELLNPALLGQFYSQPQLESDLARKIFLLPRLTPARSAGCV
jgi:hypothetical protein